MSTRFPEYLRLHVEESASQVPAQAEITEGLTGFCQAFRQATGWQLSLDSQTASTVGHADQETRRGRFANAVSAIGETSDAQPPVALPVARELATAFADLIDELQQTRGELSCREAELAAGVPVTPRPDEERHLAQRLASVLKGGAEAVACQAAALYSLDDATTQLKMRALWGLSPQRLLEPARPLRGAVADLEALVGHAVVIEDTSLLPHWRVPEKFASAVCVPVSSPHEPLGTLWVFSDRVRPFTPEQTNLIEIIAGRIASELQREVLLNECISSKQLDRQLARASQWQTARLPNVKPLLDDWRLAGETHTSQVLGHSYYDWLVPPDGSLALALGSAEGPMLESALTVASLQIAVRAHAEQAPDAAELVTRVSETFWNCSSGGQFASLFYATIDPESGALRYASAGAVPAHLVSKSGVKELSSSAPPLGTEPFLDLQLSQGEIQHGDAIVIVDTPRGDSSADPLLYLEAIHSNCEASAEELAGVVRSLLAETGSSDGADFTVLVAKRR